MGFFGSVGNAVGSVFSNPVTGYLGGSLIGGPVAGIAGGLLGNKNQQNAAIDGQIMNPGAAPGYLDPNDLGGEPQGLSAYGRMQQANNAVTARGQNEQAQGNAYGDLAAQRSALAARGGLSSGASERLAQGAMGNQAAARQGNAYNLMQANNQAGANDLGNQMQWNQYARLQNQQMQGQIYGGNQMANATLEANRPKGLLGLGMFGL